MAWFNAAFTFCTPLSKAEQVTSFKGYLNDLWTNIAMMDYPYPTNFLSPLPGNPVNAVCQVIASASDPSEKDADKIIIQAIAAGVNLYNNYTGKAQCLSLGEPDDIGAGMWDYQACTEMVMPMCFDGINDMFEPAAWNFTQFAQDCQARWKVSPRNKMADIMYGSKALNGASNIIFRYSKLFFFSFCLAQLLCNG